MHHLISTLTISLTLQSFPGANITFKDESGASFSVSQSSGSSLPSPPYRIEIRPSAPISSPPSSAGKKRKETDTPVLTALKSLSEDLVVTHYNLLNPGPYPEDQPPQNKVRFTPVQIEAVRSGMNPGLTMVVGPPGTGKTDVAVQIISALYHNNPTQKILLVTHSNAALNDLFEKIMERNVDPRHLLRLGSGEKDLRETLAVSGAGGGGRGQGEAFSKQGRVDWTLTRRMHLLEQVQRLAVTINVPGDVGYTCETAEYFRLEHIQSRIEKFYIDLASFSASTVISDESTPVGISAVQKAFPFTNYFLDTPKPLFTGEYQSDILSAEGCFRHVSKLFEELADYRAFELLRTQGHRSDYLLTKQVRTWCRNLLFLIDSTIRFRNLYISEISCLAGIDKVNSSTSTKKHSNAIYDHPLYRA